MGLVNIPIEADTESLAENLARELGSDEILEFVVSIEQECQNVDLLMGLLEHFRQKAEDEGLIHGSYEIADDEEDDDDI
jgi:hypothetical protein